MKKTAIKKPAKLAPLIMTAPTADFLSWTFLAAVLSQRSTRKLKEDLRARSLPIQKTKEEMIDRLSEWARREGGTLTLELQ